MSVSLAIMFAAAMAAVAPNLGIAAYITTAALFAVMLGSGRVLCRVLGVGDAPFIGIVTGFVLLSHALFAADFVVPGVHWQIAVAVGLVGLPGLLDLKKRSPVPWRSLVGLWLFVALFTFVWCADIAPRLIRFRTTGEFDFWVDEFVHAGTLAQFASQEAIGRGMVLMADVPQLLYHYASYLPAALLPQLAGVSLLDATLLWWMPLGVLMMACGVVALGLALEGPPLAVLALVALALMPDPAHFALGNGFLSFAWLLETSPATPYSLGVACAALGMLVRWMRDQRGATLALAMGLAAGCFFVRVNTFLWLAPVMALGAVTGWPGLSARLRWALLAAGLIGLIAVFAALSWQPLRANPVQFLFSYIEFVQQSNPPTFVDRLYPALMANLGRLGAGLVGLGLTFLGTLGPWLPAFLALALLVHRRGQLEAIDALPFLLLIVAAIEILMAPVSRNGDIGEFRHRAGPLLVAVISIWTLRLGLIIASPILLRTTARGRRIVLTGLGAASLVILNISIGGAKEPRMRWGADLYGTSAAPELLSLAPLLSADARAKPRFAVAGLPPTARVIDNAARLVALSGIPAYISCPAYFQAIGGPIGAEAQRRTAVLAHLAEATSLEALHTAMRSEGITHYLVTTPQDASFDPERRGAIGHVGTFAIYAAQ
jgi:hypothetical protein